MKALLTSVLLTGALLFPAAACAANKKGKAKGPPSDPVVTSEAVNEIIAKGFPRWDKNKNDQLDNSEAVGLVESPAMRGLEAAFLSRIFRNQLKDSDDADPTPDPIHKDRLLALANSAPFIGNLREDYRKLTHGTRALMTAADPSLLAFHQGALGDCYFMAPVAAAVNRDPGSIRTLFKPAPNGEISITWPNGKTVNIPPITDGEFLLAGAKDVKGHGLWLKTLEKAFAQTRFDRKLEQGLEVSEDSQTFGSMIGKGGNPAGPMSILTGKPTRTEMLSRIKDPEKREEKAEKIIGNAVKEKRLLCCGGVNKSLQTRGLPGGHIYSIMGYDAERRVVHVFNPWGNDFNPKGGAGIKNGYPTRDGHFKVPMADFARLWGFVCYEVKE